MQNKQEKTKKSKKESKVKVHDLKPAKDVKGGRTMDRSVDRNLQRSVDSSSHRIA
jgi:hypothetical protein